MRQLWKVGAAVASVAAFGVGATTAAADPSERGQGAPGRVCLERGLTPGSLEFRQCVRELAQARGQGNGNGGGPAANRRPAVRAARQACRADGLQPGTAEFRQCVKTKRQEARAQRQALRAQRRAARQACLAEHERRTPALRQCLRAAKQLGR